MNSGDIALVISLAICIPATAIAIVMASNMVREILENRRREVGK